jgi:arylsulfatase
LSYYIDKSNNQTRKLWRGDEVIEEPFDNRMLTAQFTAEAIRFVRANKGAPFFLYLPYTAPHFPVQAHPDWKGESAFGEYGDVVEELDSRVGEILATLEDLEIDKKTIVVFFSDNGPNPGEKANCLPFRGEKWSALEGGTRVPCIIRWPGVIPAGTRSDALVGAIDLLPTLCQACGIDVGTKSVGKPVIDGVSVWNTILGNGGEHPRKDLLYWHGMSVQPQAIRVGDWKLFFDRDHALRGSGTARRSAEQAARIEPYLTASKKGDGHAPFLFNLRNDPGETEDLSEKFPERVREMEARAEAIFGKIMAEGILPISTPAPK